MSKLSLVLGGVALAVSGYGLKKWYDKTKEENDYLQSPCEVFSKMVEDGCDVVYSKLEDLEGAFDNFSDIVDEKLS